MNIFKNQKCKVQSADGGAKCKTGDCPQFCVLRFAFCVDSGFTLVEVFISMAIFVAVMVAVGTFLVNIYSNNRTVSGSFQTAQDAQVILKTMLTELRKHQLRQMAHIQLPRQGHLVSHSFLI